MIVIKTLMTMAKMIMVMVEVVVLLKTNLIIKMIITMRIIIMMTIIMIINHNIFFMMNLIIRIIDSMSIPTTTTTLMTTVRGIYNLLNNNISFMALMILIRHILRWQATIILVIINISKIVQTINNSCNKNSMGIAVKTIKTSRLEETTTTT